MGRQHRAWQASPRPTGPSVMASAYSRRSFLHTAGVAGFGLASLRQQNLPGASAMEKVNVLSIGVVGSIGSADHKQIAGHPAMRFARQYFPQHGSDRSQAPSRASLGLPAGNWPD